MTGCTTKRFTQRQCSFSSENMPAYLSIWWATVEPALQAPYEQARKKMPIDSPGFDGLKIVFGRFAGRHEIVRRAERPFVVARVE
jgi:hypothetical protein